MGYESKLFVVEKLQKSVDFDKKKHYAPLIAIFDMCNIASASCQMRAYPITELTTSFGDKSVVKDKYGKELTEIPLEDTIKILEDAQKEYSTYRRLAPVIAYLKTIDKSQFEDVVVLHYGY